MYSVQELVVLPAEHANKAAGWFINNIDLVLLDPDYQERFGLLLWRLDQLFGEVDIAVAYLNGALGQLLLAEMHTSENTERTARLEEFYVLSCAYFRAKHDYPFYGNVLSQYSQIELDETNPILGMQLVLNLFSQDPVTAWLTLSKYYYLYKTRSDDDRRFYQQQMQAAVRLSMHLVQTDAQIAAYQFFLVHAEWDRIGLPTSLAQEMAIRTTGPYRIRSAHIQLMSTEELGLLWDAGGVAPADELTRTVYEVRINTTQNFEAV